MTTPPIGRLERVDLRTAWVSEATDFTPWLAKAENLSLLSDALDIELQLEGQEQYVGPFRADILCRNLDADPATDHWVLIENQLEKTNHGHLGQLLTYAAGLQAQSIVWIASRFTDEHRAALDWLNSISGGHYRFFGVEVELWQIGPSAVAPKFNVVSKPNSWSKSVQDGARAAEVTDERQAQLAFWTGFKDHLSTQTTIRAQEPRAQPYMIHTIGRAGFHLGSVASLFDIDTRQPPGQLRVELVMTSEDAKAHFGLLELDRAKIDAALGPDVIWRNNPNKKRTKIYVMRVADLMERAEWPAYYKWLSDHLERFHAAFVDRVARLGRD